MRQGRYKPNQPTTNYRINHRITAPQVRLISEDNKQIGVMSLSEALKKAQEVDLDLVEVASKAQPPVVRVIDFKKFQYLEAKKLAQQKKGAKKGEMKEIRLKPFMADGDYQVRVKRVKEFINDGNQVRITVPMPGRLIVRKEFGYQIINKLVTDLGDLLKVDQEPRQMGKNIIAVVSGNKGGAKTDQNSNIKNQNVL